MPVTFCTTSAGQSQGLQETWLQASALDWPTTLLSPRKSFCSTDMPKMLLAQRTISGREEEEPRKYVKPQTPSFHAEKKLFFTIPRTRIYLTKLYAAIPFHTTSTSSTCRTVSLVISTSSFSLCTGHRGCELSPRFKWKSGMAMSWTSTKLFSG